MPTILEVKNKKPIILTRKKRVNLPLLSLRSEKNILFLAIASNFDLIKSSISFFSFKLLKIFFK